MSISITLPGFARAASRTGARVIASGALAVGLLTTAPSADVHAATPSASPSASSSGTHTSERRLTKAERRERAHQRHERRVRIRVTKAVKIARRQKGDPYAYGADGPGRFDCSGLTYYSFRKAGITSIPRTSSAQAGWARHISKKHMHQGDLMFFTDGGGVYHVGIYVGKKHGKRLVLHAPYSGTHVRTDTVWTDSWFAGTLRNR